MKWNRIRVYSLVLITGLMWQPVKAASLGHDDLPTNSNWYVHINLEQVRDSNVGQHFMLETVNKVMDEIQNELDIDLRKGIEGVTLFGGDLPTHTSPGSEGAIVLHGVFSEETKSSWLSVLENEGAEITTANYSGRDYYVLEKGDGNFSYTDDETRDLSRGLSKELYFSFGSTQLLATINMATMELFLDGNGYLGDFEQVSSGALLVLGSDRALLQGGANTSDEIAGELDSAVLQNVEAAALVVAEELDGVRIDARLVASSADAAMSVRNIVEGLVALKALSDSEGAIGEVLQGVRFENDGATVHMSVLVSAEQIAALKGQAYY